MPANLVREKAVIWDLFTDRQPIGAEVQTGTRGRSRGWGSRRCDICLVDGSGYELTEHRSEQQLGIEEGVDRSELIIWRARNPR
jgi:hypothetical protein